jgi:hypothetical protein
MTSKSDEKTAGVTIEDPNNVREIFADAVVGFDIEGGVVRITLAVARPRDFKSGIDSEANLVVVSRLLLSRKCAEVVRGVLNDNISRIPVAKGSESVN